MTDRSPTLWASADLTPVSPAPVHPSSPVIVPALQDQADTLSTMSQPQISQARDQPGPTSAYYAGQSMPASHVQVPIDSRYGGIVDRRLDQSHPGIDNGGNDNEARRDAERVKFDKDTGELNSAAQEPTGVQRSTPQTNGSIDSINATKPTHSGDAAISHNYPKSPSPLPHTTSNNLGLAPHTLPLSSRNSQDSQIGVDSSHQEPGVNPSSDETETSARESNIKIAIHEPTESDTGGSSANNANDIDIQALVDTITARAAEDTGQPTLPPETAASPGERPAPLPPKPAPSHQQAPVASPENITSSVGAPGALPSAKNTPSLSHWAPAHLPAPSSQPLAPVPSQQWESFLRDERKFVSEARWDRFPEGSRIFIGNLSSERVSKKEVFDIFAPYGALAQISLKQAYGFVQYHTSADGQAAMDNLQGIEIKGRRVHLEFSHPQKKDRSGDGDKHRRNKRERREADRYDGSRGRRDDYRPGHQSSPRRDSQRHRNSYGSDHSHRDSRRGRSRSPSRHGGRDFDGYRQRSPDPYRAPITEAELDIPRRYGASVPDVQFVLREEVSREFISWVERAFVTAGLRVEVMFLNPRFPRDAVIQRQVVEGVHAVAELDYRAQQLARIPLQVFDRSAGRNSVRFDQYQDLDPSIASQLVMRAKSAMVPPPSPYGGGGGGGHAAYNGAAAYGGAYPAYPPTPQAYPPPSAQAPYLPPQYPPSHQPYPGAAGGPVDNSTLHQILGNLHGPQQHAPTHGMVPPHMDVNTLIPGYGPGSRPDYQRGGPGAHPPTPGPGPGPGDPNSHVQNIMEQLSRYR